MQFIHCYKKKKKMIDKGKAILYNIDTSKTKLTSMAGCGGIDPLLRRTSCISRKSELFMKGMM